MPIAFDEVELLSEGGLTRTYRIEGKAIMVGRAVPLEGTTVRDVGAVGRLVLPRWYVEQEGLDGGCLLPE